MKTANSSIEQNKIRFYYYIGSVSSILFLVVLLTLVYASNLNQEYNRKIEQLSSGIIKEKKRFLRNAVERTISWVESERKLIENLPANQSLNQEQIDAISAARISHHIRNLRLIDDGYVWVNRIVNYAGGDNYAIRQIHPNLPQTEGDWLSTQTKDIKGNKPYEVELNGVKKDGEIYFDYYFKKLNSDKIAHKMSFAKLYKPWDWVVASGVYLDDVDQLVRLETERMKQTLTNQRIYSIGIAAVAVVISTIILIRFEKQISQLIESHQRNIDSYTSNLIIEKQKTERALAEIKQLKGMLPICAKCKKIRDDKGYWNHLESYIEEHSDASFSHGLCPDCVSNLYGDQLKSLKERIRKE